MSDLRVRFPEPCAERWEDMKPQGCNRHCSSCDTLIHDLSQLTVDQAKRLIEGKKRLCVRARVRADGEVLLKSAKSGSRRRMVAALGASLTLAAGYPMTATAKPAQGQIKGKVDSTCAGPVTAKDENGKTFKGRVSAYGTYYKVKRLPPGTYNLEFESGCGGEKWNSGTVAVVAGKTTIRNVEDPNEYIIVGQLEIENHNG